LHCPKNFLLELNAHYYNPLKSMKLPLVLQPWQVRVGRVEMLNLLYAFVQVSFTIPIINTMFFMSCF